MVDNLVSSINTKVAWQFPGLELVGSSPGQWWWVDWPRPSLTTIEFLPSSRVHLVVSFNFKALHIQRLASQFKKVLYIGRRSCRPTRLCHTILSHWLTCTILHFTDWSGSVGYRSGHKFFFFGLVLSVSENEICKTNDRINLLFKRNRYIGWPIVQFDFWS